MIFIIIFFLGIVTLSYIQNYKNSQNYQCAKTANTLATVILIFSTIYLIAMAICALGIAFFLLEDENYITSLDEENISILISLVMFFLLPVAEIIFGFVTAAKGRSLYKNLNSGTYKQSVTNYQYNYNRYSTADSSNSFLNASGEDIRANSTVAQQTYSRADEIQGIPSDAINVQTLSEEAVKRLRKWKCPNCKKTNSMDETFCKNCGTNQSVFY